MRNVFLALWASCEIALLPNLSAKQCSPASGQREESSSHPLLSSAANSALNTRDFRSVDHRLKLYLDMEVFEENDEEFQCFLKVSSSSSSPTTCGQPCS